MEYVFGNLGGGEVLRIKGDRHTDYRGYVEVEQEIGGEIIVDRFRVVKKLETKDSDNGTCYDWYEIDRHYRYCDKTPRLDTEINDLLLNILKGASK